jgi:hypothetical protein
MNEMWPVRLGKNLRTENEAEEICKKFKNETIPERLDARKQVPSVS